MVECAAKGTGTVCLGRGRPSRRCGLCGAVAYCSSSHQLMHWKYHKEECSRLQEQMRQAETLDDFPFTFSTESGQMENRCSLFISRGIHHIGLWKSECCCSLSSESFDGSRNDVNWGLPSSLCPCMVPKAPLATCLSNWKDYYQWRHLPFDSPVALVLHWPLTIYHCFQLRHCNLPSGNQKLVVHYLGPEKELLQLAAFRELGALFPGMNLHIDFFGPEIPLYRDGEQIELSNYACCIEDDCCCRTKESNRKFAITVQFHKGFYHDRYRKREKVSFPDMIVAPNAGVAAYSSWMPTIELINQMSVPAYFSDYCEEAANLAVDCIMSITRRPLCLAVQVNPFRQPAKMENNALYLPCYSNCYLFGI